MSTPAPAAVLRHPAEIPLYAFMVLLNVWILGFLLYLASGPREALVALSLDQFTVLVQTAAWILIALVPGLVIVRQVQRAAIRGTAVELSRTQFPDIYDSVGEMAQRLGLRTMPGVYLTNGNGALNAFAAQSGLENNYTVISNELFANMRDNNREGLRFILGHELAHIRLGHVALWYQLSICFSSIIPILGPTLSRLREYSCDRNGASMEPRGEKGLIMLAAGRYAHENVAPTELVEQGRTLGGFWVEVAQLNMSHPWTVRRLWRLHELGLFRAAAAGPAQGRAQGGPPRSGAQRRR